MNQNKNKNQISYFGIKKKILFFFFFVVLPKFNYFLLKKIQKKKNKYTLQNGFCFVLFCFVLVN